MSDPAKLDELEEMVKKQRESRRRYKVYRALEYIRRGKAYCSKRLWVRSEVYDAWEELIAGPHDGTLFAPVSNT